MGMGLTYGGVGTIWKAGKPFWPWGGQDCFSLGGAPCCGGPDMGGRPAGLTKQMIDLPAFKCLYHRGGPAGAAVKKNKR